MAFEEFDLPYRWDEDLYGELLAITGGQRRIDRYLTDQGVPEDERERLAPALHGRKTEILQELVRAGRIEIRPGARRLIDEVVAAGLLLGVATTGSRGWVEGLLGQLLEGIEWQAVVTGDEVAERKPDPEAFTLVLERLGVDAAETVVVEDSAHGLNASVAVGIPCVVVVNGYTADEDFDEADLVLDGFGEPDDPATVVSDRAGTGCDGVLTLDVLRRVSEKGGRAG